MTSSSGRRATSRAALLLLAMALPACGGAASDATGAAAPAGVSVPPASAPVAFAFDSLDDRPVSSEVSRGKPTVLAFVTTGSLPAQAQVDFLVTMAANDGDRVFYAVVSLDPSENRELVEIYRKSLGVKFPMAMADEATRAGAGPFGDVTTVPVTIVLDRLGRVVWRVDGRVAKSDELRTAMRGL
jgi:thiol-disulfide isomerase/thioredoxin